MPDDEREFCCNRYALWYYVLAPREPELHAPWCWPDAYVAKADTGRQDE